MARATIDVEDIKTGVRVNLRLKPEPELGKRRTMAQVMAVKLVESLRRENAGDVVNDPFTCPSCRHAEKSDFGSVVSCEKGVSSIGGFTDGFGCRLWEKVEA